jgi:hypothetical protein
MSHQWADSLRTIERLRKATGLPFCPYVDLGLGDPGLPTGSIQRSRIPEEKGIYILALNLDGWVYPLYCGSTWNRLGFKHRFTVHFSPSQQPQAGGRLYDNCAEYDESPMIVATWVPMPDAGNDEIRGEEKRLLDKFYFIANSAHNGCATFERIKDVYVGHEAFLKRRRDKAILERMAGTRAKAVVKAPPAPTAAVEVLPTAAVELPPTPLVTVVELPPTTAAVVEAPPTLATVRDQLPTPAAFSSLADRLSKIRMLLGTA